MPILNPRETYKALLLNYDTLLAASDAECCYSLSEREIQMIMAFVDYIGWKTRYEATETEIDQLLIDHWMGNLARKLMTGCCPDDGLLRRFTSDGVFETSDDGGETWTPAPELDPRNDAIENPPLPGSDGDAKRCAAADNVRDLFLQYRDNLVSLLGASPTLVSIIAGILAFIAVITGVSGAAIGISVLLMGLASFLLTLTPEEVTDQLTEEVLETFKCLVYCRMSTDGRLSYEDWQGLLSDIASTFDDLPELFFYQTVNAMGYIGVNNAGSIGAPTADDCGDCDCPAECNDASLILIGTVTETGVYDGHPGIEVEAAAITGGYAVRWGQIDQTVPPNTCCYFFDVVTLEGSINSSYWTDCDGAGHVSPSPSGHYLGHVDYYFLTPGKVRLLFGT